FDVNHLYMQFLSRYATSHCRSDIPNNQTIIRFTLFSEQTLISNHDCCSLFGLSPATGTKIDVRMWNIELIKKGIAHVLVVVLTCVNETKIDVFTCLFCLIYGMGNRCDFHKIWP